MMFLNVNLSNSNSGGGGGGGGECMTTPRTPEILNLLSGAPFDNGGSFHSARAVTHQLRSACAASTPGDGPSSPGEPASSFSSFSSSPATPSTPGVGPPSIQNTRTYLIKEGLKLTIQSKRFASGRASLQAQHLQLPFKDEMGQLTTEDEDRRQRRRERNKVAATKCRNRKKERTGILMQESDVLEDQNVSFRSEIQRLETEKRRLMDVLAMHSPNCLKTPPSGGQTGSSSTDYVNNTIDPSGQHNGQYSSNLLSRDLSTSSFDAVFDCRDASSSSSGVVLHNNSTYDYSENGCPSPYQVNMNQQHQQQQQSYR